MSKEINIFISHSWQHVDDLKKLKNLLESRKNFKVEFKQVEPEKPIKSEESSYIRKVLKKKLNESNVVLGIAGMYASYSDWMEWELNTAVELGINVVGVIPRGQKRISQIVTKYSSENVMWNTESIVEAIRKYSNI